MNNFNYNLRFNLVECVECQIVQCLQNIKPTIKFVVVISCSSGIETISARCQDDKTVEAIIYFGAKCLCPSRYSETVPILFLAWIPDQVDFNFINESFNSIKDSSTNSLLMADITNSKILDEENFPKLKIPYSFERAKFTELNRSNWYFEKSTLNLFGEKTEQLDGITNSTFKSKNDLSEYDWVIFIGECQNLEMIISCKNLLIIDPQNKKCIKLDGAKEFRKRVSIIEKFKVQSKESIGIVFLDFKKTISDYVNESYKLCKKIKKLPYFITLNQFDYESRLGNFTQLTGFVFINCCSCNYEICDRLGKYLYPILFWKEFLIACGHEIKYGQIKWNENVKELDDDDNEKMDGQKEDNMSIIQRDIFQKPDSWYGLVVDSGSTSISQIKEGRKGIASSYNDEQELF